MMRHVFTLLVLAPATMVVTSALVALDIALTFTELARGDAAGRWS
jgi:hypothetical protein